MTESKIGHVTDRNNDETSVTVDFDYSGHNIDDNAVVLKVKDNCYPNESAWLTPQEARNLAEFLKVAANVAEKRNEDALKEEAAYHQLSFKSE